MFISYFLFSILALSYLTFPNLNLRLLKILNIKIPLLSPSGNNLTLSQINVHNKTKEIYTKQEINKPDTAKHYWWIKHTFDFIHLKLPLNPLLFQKLTFLKPFIL